MGNLCGTSYYYNEEALKLKTHETSASIDQLCLNRKLMNHSSYDATNEMTSKKYFIRVHLQEPDNKVLIVDKGVTNALVEQVEELLRRDEIGTCTSDTSNTDSIDASLGEEVRVRSIEASVKKIARIPSALDRTVATTVSAATKKAGNSPRKESRVQNDRIQSLHMVDWSKNEKGDTLQRLIYKEVASVNKRKPLPYWGCYFLSPLNFNEEQMVNTHRVKDHVAVLHLRLRLRCIHFFKLHLSRKLPNHPLTIAIEDGIRSTNLKSTQVSAKSQRLPFLINASDDSCSSSSVMEFGAGPPSSLVRLLVTDNAFLDLAVSGSLGLASRKRRPRATYIDHRVLQSPDEFVVLLNRRSGVPLAVCALRKARGVIGGEHTEASPIVRMYSTKRRFLGQTIAATTEQLGLTWSEPLPLYMWAEFMTSGAFPDKVSYSIHLVTDSMDSVETSPSYYATQETPGSPDILVTGRTSQEWRHSGCAVLSMCTGNEDCDDDDVFLKLSMAKGVDPALLICFSCFVDELWEKTMRKQMLQRLE